MAVAGGIVVLIGGNWLESKFKVYYVRSYKKRAGLGWK